jgi:hypothetical protein
MSTAQPQLTKENAPLILSNFIGLANLKGAFLLRESHLLKKAIDYVNPEVKTKPTFTENDVNPRITALRLLVQGAHKAQQQGSFRIDDSSFLYTVCEFVEKDLEAAEQDKPAKPNGTALQGGDDEEDADLRPITVTKKAQRKIADLD